jgi:hypothetical protein
MLDQGQFEFAGIFDRFDIRQRYVNPEEIYFLGRNPELGFLNGVRSRGGTDVFFADDLPLVPEESLVLTEESALPWLNMSEGLVSSDLVSLRTRADRAKFYMRLDKEPRGDWELTLKGGAFGVNPAPLTVVVLLNNWEIGMWQIDKNSTSATFTVPRACMEESFEDEARLVTLMMYIPDIPSFIENDRKVSAYGLQLEEIRLGAKDGINGKDREAKYDENI